MAFFMSLLFLLFCFVGEVFGSVLVRTIPQTSRYAALSLRVVRSFTSKVKQGSHKEEQKKQKEKGNQEDEEGKNKKTCVEEQVAYYNHDLD